MSEVPDPMLFLGRAALLDLSLKATIASYLANSRDSLAAADRLLSRVPLAVRLQLLGQLLRDLEIEDDFPGFVDDVRKVFALRNTYAHTMWAYAVPQVSTWVGFVMNGDTPTKVMITEDALAESFQEVWSAIERDRLVGERVAERLGSSAERFGGSSDEVVALLEELDRERDSAQQMLKVRVAEHTETLAAAVAAEVIRLQNET